MPACLASVSWSDDVHVFDSESTDRTRAIAEQAGAHFHTRPFDNYAAQRNAALRGLSFKYDWLLILDADERIPDRLHREIATVIGDAPEDVAAFRIRRNDYLGSTHLKYSQLSPFYVRLVRHRRARYEREVNEIMKVDGEIVDLKEAFSHYPFSKGMAHWLAKHNVYSSMEAEQVMRSRRGQAPFSLAAAFTAKDFNERRYHQKELFYRLPARPLIKFVFMYVVRRGFLDGRAGLNYASLQAIYEYMIVLKTEELEERERQNSTASRAVSSIEPKVSDVEYRPGTPPQ